ncbi:MAG: hypothetical protein ABJK28_04790 [Algibacter sp.]
MRLLLFFIILLSSHTVFAKEWKSLNCYQKTTQEKELSSSDWLKSDRLKNTLLWEQVNTYNLQNNLPQEYQSIVERRDFYKWLYQKLDKETHQVYWVKMAHFISKKMHLIEVFPYAFFTKKNS